MILQPSSPYARLTGLLKLNHEQALRMFGFEMREDAEGIIFRQYSYLDENYKVKRTGTFISNYIQPFNPQTPDQQEWRAVFRGAISDWQGKTSKEQQHYNRLAKKYKLKMSGFNYYVSLRIRGLV